jgi:hypothetical protein
MAEKFKESRDDTKEADANFSGAGEGALDNDTNASSQEGSIATSEEKAAEKEEDGGKEDGVSKESGQDSSHPWQAGEWSWIGSLCAFHSFLNVDSVGCDSSSVVFLE